MDVDPGIERVSHHIDRDVDLEIAQQSRDIGVAHRADIDEAKVPQDTTAWFER